MRSANKKISRKTNTTDAAARSAGAATRLREESAEFAQLKLESVFETSPEPLAISRVSDGAHIAVNQAWCETTGHAREQTIGRSALALRLWADPADRERLLGRVGP